MTKPGCKERSPGEMPEVAIFPGSLRDSLMHIFFEFIVEKKMSVILIYIVMFMVEIVMSGVILLLL